MPTLDETYLSATLNSGHGNPRCPGAEGLPRRPPCLVPVSAEQHLLERLAEDLVEDRVEYRVHHGASVTQPSSQVEDLVVDLSLAIRTHCGDQVQDEEWRPKDDEGEEHHT